jgi:hypothetical protein
MPYIKQDKRDILEVPLKDLIHEIQGLLKEKPQNAPGILNYCITTLITYVYNKETKYEDIAAVTGMLENVKQEFYRRYAVPYEDEKIKENGDIFMYDYTDPR